MEILLGILIGIFLVLAVIFFIVAKGLKKSGRNFKKGMTYGQAEVIGYDRDEGSSWYSLVVRLCGLDSNHIYNCKSRKISTADYPKGKIVEVIYAPKYVWGEL